MFFTTFDNSASEIGTSPIDPPHHLLGDKACPVKSFELPSFEEFLCCAIMPAQPIIITKAISDWPALARWRNPSYLMEVAGMRTVPVEVFKFNFIFELVLILIQIQIHIQYLLEIILFQFFRSRLEKTTWKMIGNKS